MSTEAIAIASFVMTIIAVMGTNIGMFLWVRSEASADRRENAATVADILQKMHEESKEYHGKLCALEERYLKERK
jgi:hypothetical protein